MGARCCAEGTQEPAGQGVALPEAGVLDAEVVGEVDPVGEPAVLDGLLDAVPDGLAVGDVDEPPDGLVEPLAVGLGEELPDGLVEPLADGSSLGLPVGLPLGLPLPLGEGEPDSSGVNGPCSASMTARICCSKSVSWAWIWSSGTLPMPWPKVIASAQICSILAVASSLSGPSRVTKSCTAAEKVRQLVQS